MSNNETALECRVGEPLKITFKERAIPKSFTVSDRLHFKATRREYNVSLQTFTEFTFTFQKEGTHKLDFFTWEALPKAGEVRSFRINVNP